MSLFKQGKPKKAVRVAKVETLNQEKGITQSMRVSKDQREYVVCLCLPYRTVKTTFLSEFGALDQMRKNRDLYKAKRMKS
jgi:hypothetical protein